MTKRNKTLDACVYCGLIKSTFITDKLRYNKPGRVVKCNRCGLVRLMGVRATENKLKEYYQKQYVKEEHGKGVKAEIDTLFTSFYPVQRDRIDTIQKYLKKTHTLLEIGSSAGYFLHAVKKYVKNVYGIEFNPEEARYATEVKGVKTSTNELKNSEFCDMKFDHICLFQLLEHIPNPITFLQELKNYLTPKGYIHIEIPNILDPLVNLFDNKEFRNFFYQKPHLYYFSPKTLKMVVDKTGLAIVELKPFQQTSITNTLNWIYLRTSQPSRWECIQTFISTKYIDAPGVDKVKNKINKMFQKFNAEYKKILEESKFTDNLFCILQNN